MYTQFPKIVINNNTMVCKIDDFISSIDTMNIIREVISNIDCNPIWQLGGTKPYDMWINTIARKATEGLRIDNPVRGSYSARRLYKEITIDSTTVDNMIIPNGSLTKSSVNASLLYDEFIVYDSRQQFIRYLIIVKNDNY